jgi:hypothetical protein
MVKIIETNISLNDDGIQADFQSRVIEVDSWELFVDEIKSGETKNRTACIGYLTGLSLPRQTKIESIKDDGFHLSCDFTNRFGCKMRKLAYLINENTL